MIRPEDIRRKAENLFPTFLCSWLEGETFFPRTIRADRKLSSQSHSTAIAALQCLRDGSKDVLGTGYSIEWKETNSRDFGRNLFPNRIYFETQSDFLRFIGKQAEFNRFSSAVTQLRDEFPVLNSWIRTHRQLLIEIEPDVVGLLHVLRFFRDNPRPNRFARELPISVDTKFIERNERVLKDWFDIVLPDTVHSHESHFARRYGLRYPEIHVFIRFLDSTLQHEVGCPWTELSLPLSALANLQVDSAEIIITENKVTLLTLPTSPRTLGIGALGRAASELRYVPWLHNVPITYWGDIDVEGFEILSALRAEFPHVQSWLMDHETLAQYESIAIPGTGAVRDVPSHLTPQERDAFLRCRSGNLRIEQERIVVPFCRDSVGL